MVEPDSNKDKKDIQLKPNKDNTARKGLTFAQRPQLKFQVLTLITLLIIFFSLFVFLKISVKKQFLEQNTELVSEFVQKEAELHLRHNSFELTIAEAEPIFERFFEEIRYNENIIRLKIWDKNAMIIYSDDMDKIGKSFGDHSNFLRSIRGEVVGEIKPPLDPESEGIIGYEQVMEIYVPIKKIESNEYEGVIELYYSLDHFNRIMNVIIRRLSLFFLISSLILFVLLNYFFHDANRIIKKQSEAIEDYSRNLEEKVALKTKYQEEVNKRLKSNIEELERFSKLVIDRELKMVELKQKLKGLSEENERKD